ncbi:STAS domain-containing protein [Litorilituus sediminis]|uniref:STAS domain-containing protein n=1 Tax=Litorilituus sediminis TaxID=718192 RepID=A0A4P6P7G1_9GAMM|nr:STAS domain-containing protein [Litorilituus sediminis]QBG35375.1 STAS domain-containing protein [Litorilituus sediminis]
MASCKVVQKRNKVTEVTIAGELDIYCAMEFYQQHIKPLKIQQSLTLKLAKLSDIDTAGVQILIMLIKAAKQQQSPYQIDSISSALAQYSKTFQLERYFDPTPLEEAK